MKEGKKSENTTVENFSVFKSKNISVKQKRKRKQ